MATRRRTRAKSTSRRSRSNYSRSGSYRRASVPRGRAGRRSSARRSSSRQARIVVEVVQPTAVRAGEPVGIGAKVAPAPRLKPKF